MSRKENVAGRIEKGWLIDDGDRGREGAARGRKVKKRKKRKERERRERKIEWKGGIRT